MKFIKAVIRALLPIVLLGAALGLAAAIVTTAPETKRNAERRQAPLLEVMPIAHQPMERLVEARGTVLPAREVTISPEVSGPVVEMHPSLQPGGIVNEGEVLLRINPEEYELAVARAEGVLAEAQAALEVERGRQLVAEREWELFGKELPGAEKGQALALREPQLKQAEARIASARSSVDQAKLDLKRTTIHAPFDALVLSESVDIGQLVAPGDTVATLAGTDAFWVRATLPHARLGALLQAMENGQNEVRIYNDQGRQEVPVPATVLRHLGQVEDKGRMAQVLLEVQDPLALEPDHADREPLPLNSYVRAELHAGTLDGAVAIPRKALRENGQVWVADKDNTFQMRPAEIIWSQGEQLALRDTFQPGDQVVVSPVADLIPGMEVRTRDRTEDDAPVEAVPPLMDDVNDGAA